jgi:hypothetical protein
MIIFLIEDNRKMEVTFRDISFTSYFIHSYNKFVIIIIIIIITIVVIVVIVATL